MRGIGCLFACLGGALTLLAGCAHMARTSMAVDSISVVTQRDSVVMVDSVRWTDSIRWVEVLRQVTADTIIVYQPGTMAPAVRMVGVSRSSAVRSGSETEEFGRRSEARSAKDTSTITEVERSEATKKKEPDKAPLKTARLMLAFGAVCAAVALGIVFAVRKRLRVV